MLVSEQTDREICYRLTSIVIFSCIGGNLDVELMIAVMYLAVDGLESRGVSKGSDKAGARARETRRPKLHRRGRIETNRTQALWGVSPNSS